MLYTGRKVFLHLGASKSPCVFYTGTAYYWGITVHVISLYNFCSESFLMQFVFVSLLLLAAAGAHKQSLYKTHTSAALLNSLILYGNCKIRKCNEM